MLLDYATGIYSGSIYGDPSLLPLLPGEGRCDRSVVAVKAHPNHVDSFHFVPTAAGMLRLNITRKPQYAKCAHYRFTGAVVVVRDPYRAIWAEYKRHINWKEVVAGHATGSRRGTACRFALRAQSLHSGTLLRPPRSLVEQEGAGSFGRSTRPVASRTIAVSIFEPSSSHPPSTPTQPDHLAPCSRMQDAQSVVAWACPCGRVAGRVDDALVCGEWRRRKRASITRELPHKNSKHMLKTTHGQGMAIFVPVHGSLRTNRNCMVSGRRPE